MIARAVSVGLVALVLSAGLAASGARAQSRGTLSLQGDQPGAEVFVDGEQVGTMPLDPLELDPGNHTIRVSRPGYTEYTDVFRVRPGRETALQVDLLAVSMVLHVVTTPPGAQVFVDGTFAGESPVDVDLRDGEHSIRLKSFGYHDSVQSVQASAGHDDTLETTLEALPPEEVAALSQPAEPSWYERPLTWVAVGGGALAVAALVIILVVATSSHPSQTDTWCMEVADGQCLRISFAGGM